MFVRMGISELAQLVMDLSLALTQGLLGRNPNLCAKTSISSLYPFLIEVWAQIEGYVELIGQRAGNLVCLHRPVWSYGVVFGANLPFSIATPCCSIRRCSLILNMWTTLQTKHLATTIVSMRPIHHEYVEWVMEGTLLRDTHRHSWNIADLSENHLGLCCSLLFWDRSDNKYGQCLTSRLCQSGSCKQGHKFGFEENCVLGGLLESCWSAAQRKAQALKESYLKCEKQ